MYQLWERLRDWFILALLLSVSVLVLFGQNEGLVKGLRAVALDVTAEVEAQFAWVGNFLRAVEENETLRRENITLSSEVARSRDALIENRRLREQMALQDTTDLHLTPARIVQRDITEQQNLLTLDKGTRDGVQEGMGVVSVQGIIGRVVLVSARYARVMPLLNTDLRVPARVQPSDAAGLVRWPGVNPERLLMEYVVRTEAVEVGDRIVTGHESEVFPPGYLIGRIEEIDQQPGQNQLLIHLRPAAELQQTHHVFVVNRLPDAELQALREEPLR